jgi:hypothetical protein
MEYNEMLERFEYYKSNFIKKQNQTLKINIWISYLKKIIQIKETSELRGNTDELIQKTFNILTIYIHERPTDNKLRKEYLLSFQEMMKQAKKEYGLVAKGSFVGMYMAIGMSVGLALGMAIFSVDNALYSTGIAVGMVIGIVIGNTKENQLERQGKLF